LAGLKKSKPGSDAGLFVFAQEIGAAWVMVAKTRWPVFGPKRELSVLVSGKPLKELNL
jgi:hypothetical protein